MCLLKVDLSMLCQASLNSRVCRDAACPCICPCDQLRSVRSRLHGLPEGI